MKYFKKTTPLEKLINKFNDDWIKYEVKWYDRQHRREARRQYINWRKMNPYIDYYDYR